MPPRGAGAARSGPKVAFYGDDFTGSSDALGQFHRAGLRAILLFEPVDAGRVHSFVASEEVVGIAGTSRSLGPAGMEGILRPVFELLRELDPQIVQYKVSSTFDSSPTVGSIGRAAEIGMQIFGAQPVAVLPAQPALGRYTVFGTHFARMGAGQIERLDRNPAMSRHPVTPMSDADLRTHLRAQTDLQIEGVSWLAIQDGQFLNDMAWGGRDEARLVVFDALTEDDLSRIGSALVTIPGRRPRFVIGSGGLSHAVGKWLTSPGRTVVPSPCPKELDRVFAVSGSCSPQTELQIARAIESGWTLVPVDPNNIDDNGLAATEQHVLHALCEGSVIAATAFQAVAPRRDYLDPRSVGRLLAQLVRAALKEAGIRRVIVAGGDTSGYTMQGLDAVGARAGIQVAEGATTLQLVADRPELDGVEVILKGGQVGGVDFFEDARRGSSAVRHERRCIEENPPG